MSAGEVPESAPPVVRRIGYFFLIISAISAYALVMAGLHGAGARWWHFVAFPLSLAVGIGLVRERRWAYVGALVISGIETLATLVILVVVVVQPSHVGWLLGTLFTLINVALVAPPLLLLGEPGRIWFQRRQLLPAG
jgi:hypothetical protein